MKLLISIIFVWYCCFREIIGSPTLRKMLEQVFIEVKLSSCCYSAHGLVLARRVRPFLHTSKYANK